MNDAAYRNERQKQEDTLEYERGVKAWEQGHNDGEQGRPDETSSHGSYADHYASGYEEGAKNRTADQALGTLRDLIGDPDPDLVSRMADEWPG